VVGTLLKEEIGKEDEFGELLLLKEGGCCVARDLA
jgi:hypothetical protein